MWIFSWFSYFQDSIHNIDWIRILSPQYLIFLQYTRFKDNDTTTPLMTRGECEIQQKNVIFVCIWYILCQHYFTQQLWHPWKLNASCLQFIAVKIHIVNIHISAKCQVTISKCQLTGKQTITNIPWNIRHTQVGGLIDIPG